MIFFLAWSVRTDSKKKKGNRNMTERFLTPPLQKSFASFNFFHYLYQWIILRTNPQRISNCFMVAIIFKPILLKVPRSLRFPFKTIRENKNRAMVRWTTSQSLNLCCWEKIEPNHCAHNPI